MKAAIDNSVFDGSLSVRSELDQSGYAAQKDGASVRRSALLGSEVGSSCGQQLNNVFNCFIGPMVGGLKATVRSVLRIG